MISEVEVPEMSGDLEWSSTTITEKIVTDGKDE